MRHRCLVVRENDEDVTLWRFLHASREPETVRIRPTMCSNDGAVVREWAVAGQGVAIRSEWNVAADLAAGRLKRVLASWELPAADVVAMLGTRFGRSARATAFLAMLRQSLSPPPGGEGPCDDAGSVAAITLAARARSSRPVGVMPSRATAPQRPTQGSECDGSRAVTWLTQTSFRYQSGHAVRKASSRQRAYQGLTQTSGMCATSRIDELLPHRWTRPRSAILSAVAKTGCRTCKGQALPSVRTISTKAPAAGATFAPGGKTA